jgi:hypothetical protein
MNSATLTQSRTFTLKQLLIFDALTCVAMGLLLVVAATPLAALLGLPKDLLHYAGLALFPCAALMSAAARTFANSLVWTVIAGNFAWVLASVIVAFLLATTPMGFAFTLIQAAVVLLLGVMELRAAR